MKKLIIAAAIFAAAVPAMAQVNISIGQPGYYGHITIGDQAPPPVYFAQPVMVERQVQYVGQPVYLRVPPGHRKHWDKHCREYNACGQQVLFVQDDWYSHTYAPRYMQQHPRYVQQQTRYVQQQPRYVVQQREQYRDDDHGRGHDKHDKHDDNGNGHGNGHGHGHDKD